MQSSLTLAEAITKLDKPCKLSQEQVNKILLEAKDKSPDAYNEAGHTAVHEAIFQANPKALIFVLKLKPNLYLETKSKDPNHFERTPLMMAVSYANLNKYSPDDKADTKYGFNEKNARLLADQTECLRLIIDRSKSSWLSSLFSYEDQSNKNSADAAVEASKSQNFFYLDYFFHYLHIKKSIEEIAAFFDYEGTILGASHLNVVDFLLIKFKTLPIGKKIPPLHRSALYGRLDILKRLLQHKAEVKDIKLTLMFDPDLMIGNCPFKTALTYALEFYFTNKNEKAKTQQIIDELLNNGAQWRAEDLQIAVTKYDLDCLKLLIEDYKLTEAQYRYSVDMKDLRTYSLLSYAAEIGREQVTRYLVEKGSFDQDWEDKLKKDSIGYPESLLFSMAALSFDTIKLLLHVSGNRLFKDKKTIDDLIQRCDKIRPKSDSKQYILKYLTFLQAYRDKTVAILGELEQYEKAFPEDYKAFTDLTSHIGKQDKIESEKKQVVVQKKELEAKRLEEKGRQFLQLIEEKEPEGFVQQHQHADLSPSPSAPPAEKMESAPIISLPKELKSVEAPLPSVSAAKDLPPPFAPGAVSLLSSIASQDLSDDQPGFFEKKVEGGLELRKSELSEQKTQMPPHTLSQIEGVPDSPTIPVTVPNLNVSNASTVQNPAIKEKSQRLKSLCTYRPFFNRSSTIQFSLPPEKERVVDEKSIQLSILELRKMLAQTFPNDLFDLYKGNEDLRFKVRQMARGSLAEILANYQKFPKQIMEIIMEFPDDKTHVSVELSQFRF